MEVLFPICKRLRPLKHERLDKMISSVILVTPGDIMARADKDTALELIDRYIDGDKEHGDQILRKTFSIISSCVQNRFQFRSHNCSNFVLL